MNHFTPQFTGFFKSLARNNNTQWFDENRKVYEQEVKKPFSAFVEEMISRIGKHEPKLNIKASDCIFRINKDIRFSKDKIPYNTHVSANISPFGRKSKEYPGFYMQLGADQILIIGGAYMVEKDTLHKIRKHLTAHAGDLEKLTNAAAFKKKFGSLLGEKNKVLPPDLKAAAEKHPVIANKSFYYSAQITSKEITSPGLADTLMEYYTAARPVNDFLIRAMSR